MMAITLLAWTYHLTFLLMQRENLEIEFILGDYNEMSFEENFTVIFFEGSFFYQSKEGLIRS